METVLLIEYSFHRKDIMAENKIINKQTKKLNNSKTVTKKHIISTKHELKSEKQSRSGVLKR